MRTIARYFFLVGLLRLLACMSGSLHGAMEWWAADILLQGNKTMYLRSVDAEEGNIHSCYEYKLVSSSTSRAAKLARFCFPSVIIVGYKKCSTSALYALLSSHPQATVKSNFKENCPFDGKRELDTFFDSLPSSVPTDRRIISGCIYLPKIVNVLRILRSPKAFFLVILRNYADFLWSAYNFWCDPTYDNNCTKNHWVEPGVHSRSVEQFDRMVNDSMSRHEVTGPAMMKESCVQGANIYSSFVEILWQSISPENTLIVTSEDLELVPPLVWSKIARQTGMNSTHPGIMQFEKVRYNTNELKGTHSTSAALGYTPGLYAASQYQPLSNSSRTALNKCWSEDCQIVTVLTGHNYSVCSESSTKGSVMSAAVLRYISTVGNDKYKDTFYTRCKRQ